MYIQPKLMRHNENGSKKKNQSKKCIHKKSGDISK